MRKMDEKDSQNAAQAQVVIQSMRASFAKLEEELQKAQDVIQSMRASSAKLEEELQTIMRKIDENGITLERLSSDDDAEEEQVLLQRQRAVIVPFDGRVAANNRAQLRQWYGRG